MIFFILHQITSFEPFGYRDESEEVIINCSSELSGEVVIPRTVKEIYSKSEYDYAFKNCYWKITSIKFEEDSEIISISNYSFYWTKIKSADLSNCNHLTLLNESVFYKSYGLKSIKLPQNILSIGGKCFYINLALSSIDLPDSVEIIYEGAFSGSGLTTINISKNSKLKKLDSGCFFGTNLIKIFIPKSLNEISSEVFNRCKYLENITVDPENEYYKSDSKSLFTGTDNSTLFKVVESYSESEYIVPNYVTNISDWCFFNANISSIQLHNNISWIGSSTFSYCTNLTFITIPESVTSIGYSTFYSCTSLTYITIPEGVTYIGEAAFVGCTSLTNITIPESVTYIGDGAFYHCSSLTNIIISGNNIEYIGDGAFNSNENPINFFIPRKFILDESSIHTNSYPFGSNLYITSQTVLTNSSKVFFGEKSVHVHFDNTIKLSDQTTIDVLQYISIENISIPLYIPKTIHNNVCYESKFFHLTNLFININKA
ncbi:surface antigen BspA-like [Trichomonas vaginalis G3]|uniref:Surface antigen BspA-like n=1 Tax=Trichomonas vaginalis (strain ATCC PRA-98 / G3) TaxID=412133 RepID=A2D8V5_TRIV3|nr:ribonuclease inhibitor domain-containing protein [Trichomonas vaginalis G3]EAY22981.1 surface antigen BspA-like [Trichomonas vaginalis G3]KAI5518944.1 ribonuclease inhibitor domain-containing protein [Trichomonas vaginalis G3]|eukprot:XP_001583967.1 surface antigen BspA-like [Trichomonas vaginalis G3]